MYRTLHEATSQNFNLKDQYLNEFPFSLYLIIQIDYVCSVITIPLFLYFKCRTSTEEINLPSDIHPCTCTCTIENSTDNDVDIECLLSVSFDGAWQKRGSAKSYNSKTSYLLTSQKKMQW